MSKTPYASLPPIISARRLSGRPSGIPLPSRKMTGSQKGGLSFQNYVARKLHGNVIYPTQRCEPWYAYQRDGDPRTYFCSPDILMLHEAARCAMIIECKLTYHEKHWEKLLTLYLPVIIQAYQFSLKQVALVLAYKHNAHQITTRPSFDFPELLMRSAYLHACSPTTALPFTAALSGFSL